MRELQITASVPTEGAVQPSQLRVKIDGERVPCVRGFDLTGHIHAPHLHGPAATLTVHHWTMGAEPSDYVSGVYRVAVEIPVWVEFVRTPHPAEPTGAEREREEREHEAETHFLLREILRALEGKERPVLPSSLVPDTV